MITTPNRRDDRRAARLWCSAQNGGGRSHLPQRRPTHGSRVAAGFPRLHIVRVHAALSVPRECGALLARTIAIFLDF